MPLWHSGKISIEIETINKGRKKKIGTEGKRMLGSREGIFS